MEQEKGASAVGQLSESTAWSRARAAGQEHVFRFWDQLPPAGREALAAQVEAIDFRWLARQVAKLDAPAAPARSFQPAPYVGLPRTAPAREEWQTRGAAGEELLAAGKAAVFIVAGGQGTRLGLDGPKGQVPVGPVTGRSLFAIFAQKIGSLRRRYRAAIPWYLMTSPGNHQATRDCFAGNDWFGLGPDGVRFLPQRELPAVDREGKLILERPDRIFFNPGGHGGTLDVLKDHGLLEEMAGQGVEYLFYGHIDNVLIQLADPVFLGFHAAAGAEMSLKFVRKTDPAEKVGLVVSDADERERLRVVEYSEMSEREQAARDDNGDLRYCAGSIGIHWFSLDFLARVAGREEPLPVHVARKPVPHVDGTGRIVKPREKNGCKFETFIFDLLPASRRSVLLETARERDFSPIKNREGIDSLDSARRDLSRLYREWLAAAGFAPPAGCRVEIDHRFAAGPEELKAAVPAALARRWAAARTAAEWDRAARDEIDAQIRFADD